MQTMYFFEGQPGRKIAATLSAPLKQGSELEPLFDECMESFAVRKNSWITGLRHSGMAMFALKEPAEVV